LGQLLPELIPEYRKKRIKTTYGGCYMCSGIFLKSDNELGCSCSVGYYWSLGNISKINTGDLINGPLIQYIRESFKEGYEPFDICEHCISKCTDYPAIADPNNPHSSDEHHLTLHVEPSNRCNLMCDVCICTDERKSANTPKRIELEFKSFHKMLSEIKNANLDVKVVAFAGYGEPLFNSDLPEMSRFARSLYPESYIYLDTNANFGAKRAEEISNCGIDEVRLALDGIDQMTYEEYRKQGNYIKGIKFSRLLVDAIQKHGSKTRPIWKYILFKHNDKDEHILRATEYAKDIGIEITFDLTAGKLASTRPLSEIKSIIQSNKIGMNLDKKFISTFQD
jgi:pyruvate-formate lyase-activating enzyme